MVDIPPELWMYIAQFIPERNLHDLLGVNRIFLQLGLDVRYKEITIGAVDAQAVLLLKRLQDPMLASRVAKLNIISNNADPSGNVVQNFRNRVTETLQAIRVSLFSPIQMSLNNSLFSSSSSRPMGPTNLTPEGVTDLFVSVLPGLTRLQRLTVDFWDPPASYNIDSVFGAAWPALGSHLRTLFIGGHLSTFHAIIDTHPVLPSLEELIFQLTDPFLRTITENLDVLNTIIAPFINSFAPTLQMLMLWSWSSLDVSSLFANLGYFPEMKRICVRVPFNKALHRNPAGLAHFVKSHCLKLEELQLWLNPSGAATDLSIDGPLSNWLLTTMQNMPELPRLQQLQFYPSRLENGFDALLIAISKSDVVTLIVRDLYLQTDQAKALIDKLSAHGPNHALLSLRMNIYSFTGAIISMMAERLPALHSLSLYIGDSATNQASITSIMKELQFHRWDLYNIGIWRSGQELDIESMLAISASIPSLKSFWNKGHMHAPGQA